jgi:hypothetical protein
MKEILGHRSQQDIADILHQSSGGGRKGLGIVSSSSSREPVTLPETKQEEFLEKKKKSKDKNCLKLAEKKDKTLRRLERQKRKEARAQRKLEKALRKKNRKERTT